MSGKEWIQNHVPCTITTLKMHRRKPGRLLIIFVELSLQKYRLTSFKMETSLKLTNCLSKRFYTFIFLLLMHFPYFLCYIMCR
jgi:hypothetical protein